MTKYKKYSKREEIWVGDAWLCLVLTSNYYYCCLQSDKQKWDNKKIGTLHHVKDLVQSSSKNKIND